MRNAPVSPESRSPLISAWVGSTSVYASRRILVRSRSAKGHLMSEGEISPVLGRNFWMLTDRVLADMKY
jgi:hypothetical protein